MKKIILALIVAIVAITAIIYVPKWMDSRRQAEVERFDDMETNAQKKADDAVLGDKLGITGGNAGFGGVYSERARDNMTDALNKSVNRLDEMEEE